VTAAVRRFRNITRPAVGVLGIGNAVPTHACPRTRVVAWSWSRAV
jgi:hypothetical protein